MPTDTKDELLKLTERVRVLVEALALMLPYAIEMRELNFVGNLEATDSEIDAARAALLRETSHD